MAVATENTLKRQLTTSNMFNDRIRTTNFNELSTQELIELSFNLKPSEAAKLLENIDILTDLKNVLTEFSPNKEFQFKASFELSKRILQLDIKKEKITSSYGLAQHLIQETRDLEQEHFILLTLNTKNQIIRQRTLFIGTLNQSIAHPRDIFREAIRDNAAQIIVAHNHPSGDPTPSESDNVFTSRLTKACELIGIQMLDHLILGESTYHSYAEN
ncbi:RadC family protein [Enterococcus faecalis]|uniref:RadC family protein n=1 Tax=Enterococcus faecalis TaxID=1351 RepID=UPI0003542C2A|nr:DNA repair protein RadC [Enterococcus faecalis]EPI27666.1 putative DNA repair protein RadC [Enterococcus faecalis UP2S-6]MEB8140015.1 DNA repair protein RadC [Enterococcus faecalis]NSV98113.1 DNA repair protein RadC [Enterococcus faecalis]TQB12091.1 DNA repair protein RadC [Enterococcus faecalis]